MCMGSTGYLVDSKYVSQNHPHVYGEYASSGELASTMMESPPCVWGVLACTSLQVILLGITPMCMGSTQRL